MLLIFACAQHDSMFILGRVPSPWRQLPKTAIRSNCGQIIKPPRTTSNERSCKSDGSNSAGSWFWWISAMSSSFVERGRKLVRRHYRWILTATPTAVEHRQLVFWPFGIMQIYATLNEVQRPSHTHWAIERLLLHAPLAGQPTCDRMASTRNQIDFS